MYDLEPRAKIIGGIANIAAALDRKLDRKELAAILAMFGQTTAKGDLYADTSKIIKMAIDHYAGIDDLSTADNITTVYKNGLSAGACASA